MSIRTLLFGYEMKNGKLYVLDEEAQIVRKIYMDYMSGRSLKSIATELTSMGVTYYLEKTVWSKNIISRILADPRYAGADGYPVIISQDDFEHASGRKSAMGGAQAEIPEMTAEVKSKMVCACCGQNMGRRNKWRGREKWLCPSGCKVDVYLSDDHIFGAILNIMNRVRNCPDLLRWHTSSAEYVPSVEVIRQSKEIDRLMEQRGVEFGVLSGMVLKCVESKYDCCPLDRSKAMTDVLVDKYRKLVPSNELDITLIRETVEKISVNRNGTLTVRFINHAEVTNADSKEVET